MPISELHKRKFKKNAALFALVMGIMILIWLVTMVKMAAQAAEEEGLEACPAAITQDMPTDAAVDTCDIYARQMDYAKNNKEFHVQLEKRRENYAKPRAAALKKHQKAIEAQAKEAQDKLAPDKDESAASANEPAKP